MACKMTALWLKCRSYTVTVGFQPVVFECVPGGPQLNDGELAIKWTIIDLNQFGFILHSQEFNYCETSTLLNLHEVYTM